MKKAALSAAKECFYPLHVGSTGSVLPQLPVKVIYLKQFIIMNKIEQIKALLLYGELNLSEISYKLNYSSIAHLSNQFKKITGFSPTEYRHLEVMRRIPLEQIGA